MLSQIINVYYDKWSHVPQKQQQQLTKKIAKENET